MIDWNNFYTWHLVMPPSRPDVYQLMRIRLLMQGIDRSLPIGILGSTPEFRDMCYELGFKNVHIFEKNISFYMNTREMMIYPDAVEKLIKGDWINTLSQYKNYFSVILSDLTMGNIMYEYRDVFYEGINNALRTDGIFIDKVLIHNHFLKVSDLICEYAQKPLNLQTANLFNCQMIFCSELVEEMGMVDTSEIYTHLRKIKERKWMQPLLELTKKITPEGCTWYYGKERNVIEKSYLSHFKMLYCWEEPNNSPYYTFARHYLLGKSTQ